MNVRDHINEKALAVLDAADTNIADGTLRDLVAVEDAYNHWEDEGSPLLAARTKAVLEAVEKTMGLYDSIDKESHENDNRKTDHGMGSL